MSSFVQSLYNDTQNKEKTEESFYEDLKSKVKANSMKNCRSAFNNFKIMLNEDNGLQFENFVSEMLSAKEKLDSEQYLDICAKMLNNYIEFLLNTRPCPRCYWGNKEVNCVQCANTTQTPALRPQVIPNTISQIRKPLKYFGILKGIATEDLTPELNIPTPDDEEPEPLTIPFIKAILNNTTGNRKLYWWFASGAGTRGQEGVTITPEDCKFVDDELNPVLDGEPYFRIKIQLKAKYTKKQKTRETWVPTEIQKDMERLIKSTPRGTPLFRKENTSITNKVKRENRMFTKICERLAKKDPKTYGILAQRKDTSRLHKFTFHSFRSFAVTMLNRVDYGFGHGVAGHSVYMGQYNRIQIEQKVEYLQKSDEYLAIFTDAKALSAKDKKIKDMKDEYELREQFFQDEQERINERLKLLESKQLKSN